MTRCPRLIALALVGLALAAPARAGEIVIVGGEVHSVAAPPMVADVVIRDGRIIRVGPGVVPGPDAEVIDATGMVVTPGLVDVGSRLGLVEIGAIAETRDDNAGGDEIRSGFRAVDGLNPLSTLIAVARREGVTSVVSHPSGGLISGQSVWWDLGDPAGSEDLVVLAPASMDLHLDAEAAGVTGGSRGSTMLRYREIFADVQAWLADSSSYDRGQMRELSLSLVDLEALAPVLTGELPVGIAAHRRSDILAALRLAEEYGLAPIIVGGAEAWSVAEELAARGVPVVVNPLQNAPYRFEMLGSRADSAAILDRAGVPVILTTGDSHRVGVLRQVAGNAVRAGMAWESALAAITLRPAAAFGVAAEYGTIEPGKVANLVVWSGDPLELSTRARHVIIRGETVPLTSRQTRLFDRYRQLPPGNVGGGR